LLAQVVVIAVSALKRMFIYQSQYGFTVQRLYVEWFIYFCIVLLVLTLICIIFSISFRKFFYTCLIISILALTAVCSVNVDRMIARQNIALSRLTGKDLDVSYLVKKLSIDVVPELDALDKNLLDKLTTAQIYDLADAIYRWNNNIKSRDNLFEYNDGVYKAAVLINNSTGSLKSIEMRVDSIKTTEPEASNEASGRQTYRNIILSGEYKYVRGSTDSVYNGLFFSLDNETQKKFPKLTNTNNIFRVGNIYESIRLFGLSGIYGAGCFTGKAQIEISGDPSVLQASGSMLSVLKVLNYEPYVKCF